MTGVQTCALPIYDINGRIREPFNPYHHDNLHSIYEKKIAKSSTAPLQFLPLVCPDIILHHGPGNAGTRGFSEIQDARSALPFTHLYHFIGQRKITKEDTLSKEAFKLNSNLFNHRFHAPPPKRMVS